MSYPVRVNIMTFNVWGETRWSERKEALQECLRISNPDVLVLQEVTPTVLDAIDAALEHHADPLKMSQPLRVVMMLECSNDKLFCRAAIMHNNYQGYNALR